MTNVKPWTDELLDRLAAGPWGYHFQQPSASEPVALAALALTAHDRKIAARPALEILAEAQGPDGGVGVRRDAPQPRWPTSLAILAWKAAGNAKFNGCIDRGLAWLLSLRGKTMPRRPELGHDTTLSAWPWVEGTHSWIEPTAFAVLALKATGHGEHPRTQEGVRLLIDRQIPGGGCNYGNTFCLGQKLRPHLQPTGIALWALAGQTGRRVRTSVAWLARRLTPETPTASLSWGVLGLAAHDAAPPEADAWLQAACARVLQDDASPYKLALLALAAGRRLPSENASPRSL